MFIHSHAWSSLGIFTNYSVFVFKKYLPIIELIFAISRNLFEKNVRHKNILRCRECVTSFKQNTFTYKIKKLY